MVKNRIKLTVILLLGLSAMVVGLFIYQHLDNHKKAKIDEFHGTLLKPSRTISDISLIGPNKEVFNNQSLQGHWTFVFFGFTQCNSICPITMAKLAKMYRLLQERGSEPLPEVMMISIDPKQDTIARLNQYVKAFNQNFYGISGSPDKIKAIAKELGIVYEKVELAQNKGVKKYTLQHSGVIMLFNPQGNLQAFFTSPYLAKNLAADYQALIS